MAERKVIETIYGKFNKYEIVKDSGGVFSGPKFYIRKNGEAFRGPFSDLQSAVDAAKKER